MNFNSAHSPRNFACLIFSPPPDFLSFTFIRIPSSPHVGADVLICPVELPPLRLVILKPRAFSSEPKDLSRVACQLQPPVILSAVDSFARVCSPFLRHSHLASQLLPPCHLERSGFIRSRMNPHSRKTPMVLTPHPAHQGILTTSKLPGPCGASPPLYPRLSSLKPRSSTALTTLSFRAIRSRASDEDAHRACPEQAQRAEGNLLFVPPQKQMRGPLPDRAPYSRILNFLFPYPSVNYFDAILPF